MNLSWTLVEVKVNVAILSGISQAWSKTPVNIGAVRHRDNSIVLTNSSAIIPPMLTPTTFILSFHPTCSSNSLTSFAMSVVLV